MKQTYKLIKYEDLGALVIFEDTQYNFLKCYKTILEAWHPDKFYSICYTNRKGKTYVMQEDKAVLLSEGLNYVQ